MNRAIRVLVVDDSPDVGELLSYVMSAEASIDYVGSQAGSFDLSDKVRALLPDVLLLGPRMPGKDWIDATRQLASKFPNVRTIIYSDFDDLTLIEEAMDVGAWGWVRKGGDPQDVIDAVKCVAAGRVAFRHHGARLQDA